MKNLSYIVVVLLLVSSVAAIGIGKEAGVIIEDTNNETADMYIKRIEESTKVGGPIKVEATSITPISEALDVTGMKECKPNIEIRSADIQVTDSEDDEYAPAITIGGGRDLFLSYTSKESILASSIIWTFSTDGGVTWDPGVFYDIDGTESYPAVDYLGGEKRFAGTLLGPPAESDGSLQYLFRCDDPTDAETYELTYWDWAANFPYSDRRIPDIGGYLLDEVPWFYGIMACAGTRDVRVDMPIFNYMDYETEDSGWSSYWDEFQGCENVAVEVDQTNGYFYAVFDYLNETIGNWDLLVIRGDLHNDGEGHPIWFDALLLGDEENSRYPSVGAYGDHVMIVAQQDELLPGKQDIVCYYSSDAGENWAMSIVSADASDDELHPSIVSYGTSATCTFTVGDNLYLSGTIDGGATWSEPEQVSDQDGTFESGYRNADITNVGNVVWTDNRNENLDIYFTVGNAPFNPSTPDGPTSGKTGQPQTYSTSTTDPNGDDISYGWDWNGDDVVDEWTGFNPSGAPVSTSHIWDAEYIGEIKVKAKDTNDDESPWSNPLSVSMPKNKAVTYPLLQRFFELFPNAFPILRYLLRL